MLETFLAGAIAAASLTIALLFWKFHSNTGDRLFGLFAAAFLLLGFERICVQFFPGWLQSYVYLIRLFAFLLILFAILDKNRSERKP